MWHMRSSGGYWKHIIRLRQSKVLLEHVYEYFNVIRIRHRHADNTEKRTQWCRYLNDED